jgi:hypothetical protein
MRRYWQVLIDTLRPVAGGLLCGCVLAGLVTGIYTVPLTSLANVAVAGSVALFAILLALAFGAIPAFIYGAPLYALLWQKNKASYWSALVIGILPGLALLLAWPDQGGMLLLFGAPVSLCTHFLAQRFQSASGR